MALAENPTALPVLLHSAMAFFFFSYLLSLLSKEYIYPIILSIAKAKDQIFAPSQIPTQQKCMLHTQTLF